MTEEDSEANRRRWERRTVHLTVSLVQTNGREIRGHVENIGSGGAFFTTDDLEMRVVEEDTVTLAFTRSEEQQVKVEGQVLRIDTFFLTHSILRTLAVRFNTALTLGQFPLPEEGEQESTTP
jgi:PilZ domain